MYLRLFIAIPIEIDENTANEFAKIRNKLSSENISWTKKGQLHITLKFLGKTPSGKIDNIKTAMINAFNNEAAKKIKIESLGVFGARYNPKIVWTKIKPEETMVWWFKKLKHELEKCGFMYDRQNFVPHLSIGRIRKINDKDVLQNIIDKYKSFSFGELVVDEIALFESVLNSIGTIYNRHFTYSLNRT